MVDGETISLGKDGSILNVRADTSGAVGSVTFALDGAWIKTESLAPYALAGDDAGVYRAWTPSIGNHTLHVVPYELAGAGGAVGTPLDITFTVTP